MGSLSFTESEDVKMKLGARHGKKHHIFRRNFVFLDKVKIMDASELKLKIFKEIESLEETKLQELYGILQNIIRGEKDLEDWDELNSAQQQGIIDAIEELNEGEGVAHESVIAKYRKKYSDD